MPKILFKNREVTVDVGRGTSVLEAAMRHGIPIYHTCGGNASCSTCRVLVHEGASSFSPIDDAEAQVLEAFDLKPPHRLGCQALLMGGDVVVEIPERDKAPRPNKTPPVPEGKP